MYLWIPTGSIRGQALNNIEGKLYVSTNRGFTVSYKRQGIKCIVKNREYSRAAGISVGFDKIGKEDTYGVYDISLIYGDTTKTFRMLCINRHIELPESIESS